GHAYGQAAGRYLHIFCDQRSRPNDGIRANAAAAQEDRAHTDEHAVTDGGGMDDGAMAHGDVFAYDRGTVVLAVYDRIVLDIAPRPDHDWRNVAPEYAAEPDARSVSDGHIADEHGGGRDVAMHTDSGRFVFV